jgi:transducin (beta)-like 1
VSDRGPAPKRVREDRAPSSELSKVKQANARSQESSRTKLGKSFPQQERGGGSWCEHRDAVSSNGPYFADLLQVNCVAWNPKDKEVLVTGSSDGTARLWNFMESDTKNHALQLVKKPLSISHKSIDTGKKAVTSLVWHPDGTVFATGMSTVES